MQSEIKERKNHYLSVLIFLFGFFLHQSARTSLGNLSIADFLLIFFLIHLIINKRVYLNKTHLVILFFFLSLISFISIFYTPLIFNISISGSRFIIEIIKLLALFAFFFMGVELVKQGVIDKLLTVYSYSGLIIAVFGIALSIFNLSLFNEILFIYGSRLNGLMNDPNYFAILQITTLPYFIKKDNINNIHKFIILSIIIFSIILSGSKTGFLTLGIYLFLVFLERNMFSGKHSTIKNKMKRIFILGTVLIALAFLIENLPTIIEWLNFYFPVTARITPLFNDFDAAIISGGSNRDSAWKTGLEIINTSPIFGIGVGNYSTIGKKYFGSGVIAHNTYIQLTAEWGLPLAIAFFGGIIALILVIIKKRNSFFYLSVQKDILIIFLIGSMGISLNNARFFWLVLGATLTLYNLCKSKSKIH